MCNYKLSQLWKGKELLKVVLFIPVEIMFSAIDPTVWDSLQLVTLLLSDYVMVLYYYRRSILSGITFSEKGLVYC